MFKKFNQNQSVRPVSLQYIGFFSKWKPIFCKIIVLVLSSVGFVFETVPYQQCIKIYIQIDHIQGNITSNEQNNCKNT